MQGVCVEQSQKNKEEFDKKLEEVMKKLREEIEDRIGERVRQIIGEVSTCTSVTTSNQFRVLTCCR